MKVLLIYPDTDQLSIIPSGLINIEPLGLEYLAGALPDHDVAILDMKMERDWQQTIDRFEPDVVGITGTVVHHYRMLEVLSYAKASFPHTLTVVGGAHATLVPSDFASPVVNAVIPGQNPEAFVELLRRFERGLDPSDIPGLAVPGNGRLIFTEGKPKLFDLNSLPLPRRDLVARHRSKYRHLIWKPVALMVTSVGCPHGCSFCPCPALTNHRVLRRSPDLVVEELRRIDEPYIYIGDDNLFFDYRHARRIAELIEQAGIKKQFYALSRADEIVKHPDLVERWADIGLKKVFLGLESFKDIDIRALHKKGTVDTNSRAIEILRANRVDPLGAFIIRPEYRREDFDGILAYMDRMKIYYFEFTVLTPFPGTPFHEEVRNDVLHSDHRLYDLAHSVFPTELPQSQFYREFSRIHRKASSPWRALKIRPTISPFRRLAFFRQSPKLASLFLSAHRAYREMDRLGGDEPSGESASPRIQ